MLLTFVNTFANVLAGSVTGKIVDSRTNQPVEYATVAIYNQANNSLVTGTITDNDGKFTIDGLKNGTYILKASFIGYDQLEMRDIVVDGGVKQLGTIKLSTSDAEIEEVEVVAKKKDISYQLDKKVINLSTDINADNGSAADALEGVPSVDVDIDGNVSLRGSSNFTVLIDGKPTALDAADVLKQTPAAMIENIEIITNPSAKYDPEGTTGIINLVTKKNVVQGLNGVVNANVGSQGRVGGDFLLNKRSGKVNFFVGGYINQRGNKFHGESNRITKNVWNDERTAYTDKYVNQTNDNKNRNHGGGLRTGLDIYFDDNNLLNFSIEGGLWGGKNTGDNTYDNWTQLVGSDDIFDKEDVLSESNDKNNSKYFNTNFSYTHNFLGKGHKIVAGGFFSHNNREADNSFTQTVTQSQRTTGHDIDDDKSTNLYRLAEQNGYTIVRSLEEARQFLNPKSEIINPKLIMVQPCDTGMNHGSNLPYAIDRKEGDLTLTQIVSTAIPFLNTRYERFFMMVEGGMIDYACHADDAATSIGETWDMNDAMQVAYDFYLAHPDETLILVTADHETGGLALGNSDYTLHLDLLQNQKCSSGLLSDRFTQLFKETSKPKWTDVKRLYRENLGFWDTVEISDDEEDDLKDLYEKACEGQRCQKYVQVHQRACRSGHRAPEQEGPHRLDHSRPLGTRRSDLRHRPQRRTLLRLARQLRHRSSPKKSAWQLSQALFNSSVSPFTVHSRDHLVTITYIYVGFLSDSGLIFGQFGT